MSSRSLGVQALALVLCSALCGCSIVGLGYRASPKHKTSHQEAERLSELAQLYERQGHPAGAMRLYRQALQADPRSQGARERLMALSSQQAAPPQSPAGSVPSLAPTEMTMLAQKNVASPGAPPASRMPVNSSAVATTASPAPAPEPPTKPIRATTPRSTAAVQPSTTTPATQSSSVVGESASAVAAAAAPILALMSQPTGNLSLRAAPPQPAVVASAPVLTVPETNPAPPVELATPAPTPVTEVEVARPAPIPVTAVEVAAPAPVTPPQLAAPIAQPAVAASEPQPLPVQAVQALPQSAPPVAEGVARIQAPPRITPPVEVQKTQATPQPVAPVPEGVARIVPPVRTAPAVKVEEELLAVAVVKLPPPETAPRIEPESTADDSAWATSRSAASLPATTSIPAALPVPAPELSSVPALELSAEPALELSPEPAPLPFPEKVEIAIRPQQPAEGVAGRSTLHSSTWSPTDLVRLCPDATEEMLALVKQLESSDATIRKDGLIELAKHGDDARTVVGAVRALFHDPDPRVKAHAAWVASQISGVSEDHVAVLASVTRSDDPAAATFSAYCLGLLEQDAVAAVPALQAACESENTAIRLCAAEALLKITPEAPEPLSTLIAGLQDSAPEHRWLAALSLSAASSVYQESAVLALIPALHDPAADVCSSAALALGAYGPVAAPAAADLQAALSHSDADVREAATAALGCIVE